MPPPSITPEEPSAQKEPSSQAELLSPAPAEPALWLRAQTPARVDLRRAGISLATSELLDFQLAHARARDAVHASLQAHSLISELHALKLSTPLPEILVLHSKAVDRQTYLQRPDLGRQLDEASRHRIEPIRTGPCDLAIIIADGLSSLAVERHVPPLLCELFPAIHHVLPRLRLAPISIVEQGRVAIGDEVAHALTASMAIVLIGERPGLSSPDSLGAYITWKPQPGRTTDAERNCISNIRNEGLSYSEAAHRLVHYIQQAGEKQATGIALKDPDPAPALPQPGKAPQP
jgi:ethanolamine ammonia-lyase small subunit